MYYHYPTIFPPSPRSTCPCTPPQLGSLLAAPLMQQMDQLALQNEGLEKKLTKEKQRTIR